MMRFGDQPMFDDSDVYLPYIPGGADDPAVDFDAGMSYEEIMEVARLAGLGRFRWWAMLKSTLQLNLG